MILSADNIRVTLKVISGKISTFFIKRLYIYQDLIGLINW